MRKNTAGQKIGAQMVSASDGSAFTGSVTVYVTGDAGTQAVGSVGSGACTHEGNGYHTYAPAQAETNHTLIAFTFIGTGAIPQTIQIRTIGYDDSVTYLRVDNRDGDAIPASNGGSGAYVVTITVNDGSTVLQNATVRMTEGANTFEAATNVSGQASFSLDAATYTVSITKAGYEFTPTTLAVSGATTHTYSMSAMNITPSDPGQTTGYLTVRTAAGVAVNAATVQLQITRFANGSTGSGISDPLTSGITDSNGLVEFTGLPRQAHYRVRIGTTDDAEWYEGVTANASTTPLVNAIGEAVA